MQRPTTIHDLAVRTLTGAAALAVGLGLGAATGSLGQASAAPAPATLHDAALVSTGTLRLGDLISPTDFSDAMGVRTVSSTMGPARRAGLSACTGEQRMAQLLPYGAAVLHGYYHGKAQGQRVEAGEVAGDHAGLTAYRKVVRELRGCQHEPATHWHYGKLHSADTQAGRAIWMVAVDGDGHRDGGVVAAWSHHHLAVTEVGGGSKAGLASIAADVSARLR